MNRKKHFKQGEPKIDPPPYIPHLFDLSNDLGERNNLAEENPEIVKTLLDRMKELEAEIQMNARAHWTKE